MLCVVDDLQWLDDASARVLGFVARRLLAESVALVFTAREPSGEHQLVGLPELPLRGLDEVDARALLEMVVPGRIDERVRDRIVEETRGNPLALLELPRGMTAAEVGANRMPPAAAVRRLLDDESGHVHAVNPAVEVVRQQSSHPGQSAPRGWLLGCRSSSGSGERRLRQSVCCPRESSGAEQTAQGRPPCPKRRPSRGPAGLRGVLTRG